MKYIAEENSFVIKSWCEEPEEGAIMPDTHYNNG